MPPTTPPRGFDITEESWTQADLEQAAAYAAVSPDVSRQFVVEFMALANVAGDALLAPSGRQAIRLALRHRKLPQGMQVAVPAYCCEVVGHAIIDEGLRPRLLESGDTPGSIDMIGLRRVIDDPSVGAIIIPHLFGRALDLGDIAEICAKRDLLLIVDAAQAIDLHGTPGVAHGDFTVFSFGLEKPLSLLGGGLLVSHRPNVTTAHLMSIAGRLGWSSVTAGDEKRRIADRMREVASIRESIGRRVGMSQRLERLLRRIVRTGRVRPRADGLERPGDVRAALGRALVARYPDIRARRQANRSLLDTLLRDAGVAALYGTEEIADPLYALLLLPDADAYRMHEINAALARSGFVGARVHAPATMDDDPRVRAAMTASGSLARAHRLARTLVDLPIHEHLAEEDIHRLAATVAAALR